MAADAHALGRLSGSENRAERKAAANALGRGENIGRDAIMLIGVKLAGAAHAALNFVETQQQAALVADLAQAANEVMRPDANAALALDGLDQNGAGLGADRRLDRLEIAERNLVEAVDRRTEAVEIFRIAASGDGRQRAAVEGAFEGDHAVAFRRSIHRIPLARHLDRQFDRLRARIAEEYQVGESRVGQSVGKILGLRNFEQVGGQPQLLRLLRQGLHKMRMAVAKAGHGDARAEIEIFLAGGRGEPDALAAFEGQMIARISR